MAIRDMTLDRREQRGAYVKACAALNPAAGAGLRSRPQLPPRLPISGSAS